MKKVIIFDFDYTLGDSTEGIISSINYALGRIGFESPGRDKIVKTIGLSLAKTYEALTGKNDYNEIEVFEKYFKEKADKVMVSNTFLYDGVAEMLKNLHNKGLKIAIVTTKYHYRIEQILNVNNASCFVDGIAGCDDVNLPKPAPEGIFKIKEKFNASLEEILYVGDSVVDAEAAQAAGVDFTAVLTGTTLRGEFEKYPYTSIINKVTELEQAGFGRNMESSILEFECTGIKDGGKIPLENTGRGQDISPEIIIKNLSPDAKTLAITLEDLSHPVKNFTHWVIWNIPAMDKIEKGIKPGKNIFSLGNARQGIGYGIHRYAGPKPPKGKKHIYRFTIYSLDCKIDLGTNSFKKSFLKKAGNHILQKGSIIGSFE